MQTLRTLVALASLSLFAKADPLPVGSPAPDGTASDQNGQNISLKEVYAKGATLVYFYPKADTPGCTKQACSLRDEWTPLREKGIQVLGVSGDKPEAQKKFEQKYSLPFTLLSDPEGKLAAAFGVPFTAGISKRMSFLVQGGKIAWTMPAASTVDHAKDVLKAFAALPKTEAAPAAPAPAPAK